MVDLTAPVNPADLDRVRAIVRDRCGDVLTDDEIAEAFADDDEADGAAEAWAEVMSNICDALIEVEERLDRIEASLGG